MLNIVFVAVGVGALVYTSRREPPKPAAAVETTAVYFTPGDQTTTAVVNELNAAKKSVRMQAYSFTSAPIAQALVGAKRRGVDVIALLDKSNKTANYSSADFLAHEGCRRSSTRNTPSRTTRS